MPSFVRRFGAFVSAGRAVLRAAAHMCGPRRRSAPHGRRRAQSAVRCRSSFPAPQYSRYSRYSQHSRHPISLSARCGGQQSCGDSSVAADSSACDWAESFGLRFSLGYTIILKMRRNCVGLRSSSSTIVRLYSGGLAWWVTVGHCVQCGSVPLCSRLYWFSASQGCTVRAAYAMVCLFYAFGSV